MRWTLKGQAFFQGCFCTWALEILLSESLLSHLNLLMPQFPICKARLMIFPLSVLTRIAHKPFGTGKVSEYEFVSDSHSGTLGSLGTNVITCAVSSEERHDTVGTCSCAQRWEFSRDDTTHAPKAAMSFQIALPCNKCGSLSSGIHRHQFTLCCYLTTDSLLRGQDGSQISFKERAAMVLVCSHIFMLYRSATPQMRVMLT